VHNSYFSIEGKETKRWAYLLSFSAFCAFIIGLTIWVSVPSFGLHFQIDASSISSNNTVIVGSAPSNATVIIKDGNVQFAKIALQNIPTLINGITTSTSIIVALSGAVIGFMIRELFQSDKKTKIAFFGVFFFLHIYFYVSFLGLRSFGRRCS
jgi:hypothetical protein